MTNEALGLWNIGEGRFHRRLSPRDGRRIIREAYKRGIRTFDSAYSYLDADTILYSAMRELGIERDKWRIIEKIASVPTFEKKAGTSLKRLHTSYFDILLIHWPSEETGLFQRLRMLERMRNDGRALETGVSNFPLDLLKKAAADFEITYHERPLSLVWNRDYEEEKTLGIKTLAYAPLGMGIIASPKTRLSSLPFSSSPLIDELYAILDRIAEEKNATRADIALSWVYEQNPFLVIRGVSDTEQLGWKRTELLDEEKERLAEIAGRITALTESDNIFLHNWKGDRRAET